MKNKVKLYYLPVEVSERDLLTKSFLSQQILDIDKNAIVVLGKEYGIIDWKMKLPPNVDQIVYLDKSLSTNTVLQINLLSLLGVNIYCLDEEALTFLRGWKRWIKQRLVKRSLNKVNRYFLYGTDQFLNLKSHLPEYEDKFEITGSPRFDSHFMKIMSSGSNRKKLSKPVILFMSNFIFNRHISGKDFVINALKKMKRIETTADEDFWMAYSQWSQKTEEQFIDLVQSLAAIKKYQIFVRPHPAEDLTVWEAIRSIEIDCNPNIYSSIKSADYVIANNSTTIIQSVAMDTTTIAFEPFPEKMFASYNSNDLAHFCFSKESEVMSVLSRLGSDRIKSQRVQLKNTLADNGGRNVALSLVKTSNKKLISTSFITLIKIIWSLALFVKKILKRNINGSKYDQAKSRGFDLNSTRDSVEKFTEGLIELDYTNHNEYIHIVRRQNGN